VAHDQCVNFIGLVCVDAILMRCHFLPPRSDTGTGAGAAAGVIERGTVPYSTKCFFPLDFPSEPAFVALIR
jgi:hypothetical protein